MAKAGFWLREAKGKLAKKSFLFLHLSAKMSKFATINNGRN